MNGKSIDDIKNMEGFNDMKSFVIFFNDNKTAVGTEQGVKAVDIVNSCISTSFAIMVKGGMSKRQIKKKIKQELKKNSKYTIKSEITENY